MTDGSTSEPYWRLDAIDEDTLERVHRALRPFVAEDSRDAAVYAVVRAQRGGPRVEDYVPDAAVFARRQTVKAHMGQLLASTLRGDGGSRVDMGWLVNACAVAAEKVYEPIIAALAGQEPLSVGGELTRLRRLVGVGDDEVAT